MPPKTRSLLKMPAPARAEMIGGKMLTMKFTTVDRSPAGTSDGVPSGLLALFLAIVEWFGVFEGSHRPPMPF